MGSYRTLIILKTDIVDSTPRLASYDQFEMSQQRRQHRQFILDCASQQQGAIFDEEGDAYWLEFPSVTQAVQAAMAMHQNLQRREAGRGEKQRLAIRAVITIGDVVRQEQDTLGMVMSLTARLEKLTPPDEIYLSQAAWLVLNKAEVSTRLVGEFKLKGFEEPERIYRVESQHRTRVLTGQYIVFADIRGWQTFTRTARLEEVEVFLAAYDEQLNQICDQHGGVIRNTAGDQYFITFTELPELCTALEQLQRAWPALGHPYQLGLAIGVHQGDLNIIRSYLFGNDIHTTVRLQRLNSSLEPDRASFSILVSGRVCERVRGTAWEGQLQPVPLSQLMPGPQMELAQAHGAFWFRPSRV